MSADRTPPYAIGLTGGIGSGKTTIANLFQEHGISIIDTDAIAHQLSTPNGLAITAIRQEFGDKLDCRKWRNG